MCGDPVSIFNFEVTAKVSTRISRRLPQYPQWGTPTIQENYNTPVEHTPGNPLAHYERNPLACW